MSAPAEAWRNSRVSDCGTHHVVDGGRLYSARFLRVLPFHAPGLAPARDKGGAFHICPDGSPAYARRRLDTFGFYEGLAAVRDAAGWFHVRPDGSPGYAAKRAWCGNFQGGRCVVRSGGGYRHILPSGRLLYRQFHPYAGDFREGRAVVRRKDGLCAHLDESGGPAHGHAYPDLGVYHKGFARARDRRGWMHIGWDGSPAYGRRFAAVEPFYNGQALAETLGGDIVVVGEDGGTIADVASAPEDNFASLSADMTGFWRTFTLAAAVELGVAEILPRGASEVASKLGLPEENALNLLGGLAEMRATRLREGLWRLTDKGEYLRRAHPMSMAAAAMEWARLAKTRWDNLSGALRNARLADDYFSDLAGDPAAARQAHGMLAAYARHDYRLLPELLPLQGVRRLIDAGGGCGETARMIAARHPGLKIILLDRPEATAADDRRNCGQIVRRAANFFQPWKTHADAVLLARVLHDWSDERALKILRNARAILPAGGKLFIVEMLRRGASEGALCSLHLTVASGGRERTWDEFRRLARAAGFDLLESRSLDAIPSLIIGEAA